MKLKKKKNPKKLPKKIKARIVEIVSETPTIHKGISEYKVIMEWLDEIGGYTEDTLHGPPGGKGLVIGTELEIQILEENVNPLDVKKLTLDIAKELKDNIN